MHDAIKNKVHIHIIMYLSVSFFFLYIWLLSLLATYLGLYLSIFDALCLMYDDEASCTCIKHDPLNIHRPSMAVAKGT